jgi:exodeoxyribonuclease VIII
MDTYEHIMVDIETMGTKPGSAIVAIAAVEFDMQSGKMGKEFYRSISLKSCLRAGLIVDAGTIEWWMSQESEAQRFLFIDRVPIIYALNSFTSFLVGLDPSTDKQIWGNSARFDLGLLEAAYAIEGVDILEMHDDLPWRHWNERDVRTLASLNPELKHAIAFEGTRHNALDDCKHQIRYCSAIWNTIQISNQLTI